MNDEWYGLGEKRVRQQRRCCDSSVTSSPRGICTMSMESSLVGGLGVVRKREGGVPGFGTIINTLWLFD